MRTTRNAGRWGRLLAASALLSLGLSGCAASWDDVTSRNFDYGHLFVREDPLVVLRDSKDGDKRARAYTALKEPAQSGGTDKDQDFVIELLTTASKSEAQFYTRLMAVQKLGEVKDPRAVPGLVEAYYTADVFPADNATRLRCSVLTGLGSNGHPSGAELLLRVVKAGPVEGPEDDRRRALDERIAAARALAYFPRQDAAEALANILRTEKDVALRVSAHESLQACTGKSIPADPQAWDQYLTQTRGRDDAFVGGRRKGVIELMQAGFSGK